MSTNMPVGGVRECLKIKRSSTFIEPVDTESRRSARTFSTKELLEILMSLLRFILPEI